MSQEVRPGLTCSEGDVRLFGTKSTSEGRVEVYHSGKWGTVCDDGWDMSEAQVVCRQLHFPRAKSVVLGKNYGEASGPIWLDDINCKGTETHLFTCNFKDWGVTDCSHKEDVGVICETGSNMTIIDSTHGLDHSFSLSDDLGQLFDRGSACDFLIFVKSATGNRQEDGTPEMGGKTICAHKMILSQFPLFEASEGISNITIEIDQSCQPYFTSFIRKQNRGVSCTSLPMARLVPQSSNFQQSNIMFHNRLLLVCQDSYIFQVQDFKVNQARVATNGTQVFAYPCPEDNYIFHFVVRPHHV
ncbi:galectin-3-binding protein A-like isoform X2 [Toxotes jaculatrix]|uniref:galectin-3-binding protein A-like isoform X2 n=1 Tax=Toxotes jaculatrix TaxID=941984 RepID=UPI001B3A8CC5|nr:galectin-3-binding protein A-like isoform X2 [Toxotes jaculatrix]